MCFFEMHETHLNYTIMLDLYEQFFVSGAWDLAIETVTAFTSLH